MCAGRKALRFSGITSDNGLPCPLFPVSRVQYYASAALKLTKSATALRNQDGNRINNARCSAIISEVFVQRAVFFGLLFPGQPQLGHLTRHLTVQPR